MKKRKVTTYKYPSHMEGKLDLLDKTVKIYDYNGNCIEEKDIDKDGSCVRLLRHIYDENNLLVLSEGEGGREIYNYDSEMRLYKQVSYGKGELTGLITNEYNDDGCLIVTADYSLGLLKVYQYDDSKREIKQTTYDRLHSIYEVFTTEYIEDRKIVTRQRSDGDGSETYIVTFEKEREIEAETYLDDRHESTRSTSYNEEGKVILEEESGNGGSTTTHYTYDDRSMLSATWNEYYPSLPGLGAGGINYEREFDSFGNCIKLTVITEKSMYVYFHIIEYYK